MSVYAEGKSPLMGIALWLYTIKQAKSEILSQAFKTGMSIKYSYTINGYVL